VHFKVNLLNLLNLLFAKFFWLALPARGALNKDLTVWPHRARPATPVSHREHSHAATHCTHPKSMFGSIRKLANFVKFAFLYFKKSEKMFSQTHFGQQ
jgi:hypothetical protein